MQACTTRAAGVRQVASLVGPCLYIAKQPKTKIAATTRRKGLILFSYGHYRCICRSGTYH